MNFLEVYTRYKKNQSTIGFTVSVKEINNNLHITIQNAGKYKKALDSLIAELLDIAMVEAYSLIINSSSNTLKEECTALAKQNMEHYLNVLLKDGISEFYCEIFLHLSILDLKNSLNTLSIVNGCVNTKDVHVLDYIHTTRENIYNSLDLDVIQDEVNKIPA